MRQKILARASALQSVVVHAVDWQRCMWTAIFSSLFSFFFFLLSNSSPKSRLGVDFFFPLSQEEEEEEQEEPPPKYSRRKHSRSLKFDTQTNTLAPTPLPNGH